MEALAAQEGGMEAAQAVFAEYYSMVAHGQAEVGHYHEADDADD